MMIREPVVARALSDIPRLSLLCPRQVYVCFGEPWRQVEQNNGCGSQLPADIGREAAEVESMRAIQPGKDRLVERVNSV